MTHRSPTPRWWIMSPRSAHSMGPPSSCNAVSTRLSPARGTPLFVRHPAGGVVPAGGRAHGGLVPLFVGTPPPPPVGGGLPPRDFSCFPGCGDADGFGADFAFLPPPGGRPADGEPAADLGE